MTTTEASTEETEETTRLSEGLRQRRPRCVYGPREWTTTMATSAQELSNNNRGVSGGRGIDDASELPETTTEAVGA